MFLKALFMLVSGTGWQSRNQGHLYQGEFTMRLLLTSALVLAGLALTAPAQAQSISVHVGSPGPIYVDRRGADYWGPYGQWHSWNPRWGNPAIYANRWGFDEYHPHRGWRRDTQWYNHPSAWSGWGGWNWSFQVRGDDDDDRGRKWDRHDWRDRHDRRDRYRDRYEDRYSYRAPVIRCYRQQSRDWIRGRKALVSYVLCTDPRGRTYEEPGSRRIDAWIW
jgi:hypothetical protein